MNNWRTTSAKSIINLGIIRKLVEPSFKNVQVKVNVCSYCFGYIAVRRWVKLSVEKSLLVQIT